MSTDSAPVPEESLGDAGERIRAATPIHAGQATNEECRQRRQLIVDTLAARGIRPGERVWHTAQIVDGRVVGVWANSVEEAELELTVWWKQRCHWVVPDADCRIREEYFPRGKRSAPKAQQRFPLTGPRRPRDRFEPAGSLLEGLGTPTGVWHPVSGAASRGGVR